MPKFVVIIIFQIVLIRAVIFFAFFRLILKFSCTPLVVSSSLTFSCNIYLSKVTTIASSRSSIRAISSSLHASCIVLSFLLLVRFCRSIYLVPMGLENLHQLIHNQCHEAIFLFNSHQNIIILSRDTSQQFLHYSMCLIILSI